MENIAESLKKFAVATNNEFFDADYKSGEWMVEATQTAETLEQFAESAQTWSIRSNMKRGEVAGFPFIAWSKVQMRKGDERRAVSVIDFGGVRFAIDADLSAI